jgi:uncharacterized membrane protein
VDLKAIRTHARQSLEGNWGIAIIASLVASIFGVGSSGGSANFNFEESDFEGLEGTNLEGFFQELTLFIEENLAAIIGFIGAFAVFGFIMSIAMFFLSSIVSVGYQKFNLDLVDGRRAEIGSLFSYFKHWKTAVLSNLYVTVYVFLWTLLCVIPGIIAEYRYAMVPYILTEKPDIEPQKALEESKFLMQGNKWDLFRLQFSFIGWIMLCILSCGIGFIWLIPYMNASYAEFYRRISGTRRSFGFSY